ncbi:MAG: Hint domain-containing protein [Paracoccaceae bacterium]|nr:Hint domain-containing protein [Paracoccaceae bacterium]
MANMTPIALAQDVRSVPHRASLAGISAGTPVLTLSGAIPVEHLTVGDRIITRDGARNLRGIHTEMHRNARMIFVAASALGIDQPEEDLRIAPEQQILIRDWRAKALKGADQAMVAAAKLIDGEYIRAETIAEQRLFVLEFDAPAIIYAGGLELACTPALVEA